MSLDTIVRRPYASPLRDAGAAATRRRVLSAARFVFEARGWAGTTLAEIAREAEVSPKTIQAQFGTKARLLGDTVDFAIRGDRAGEQVVRQGAARAIRAAPNASEALAGHAAMAAAINSRAARLAAVVEDGAASEPALVPLWTRMQDSMQRGVKWAAETVLGKPGLRSGLTLDDVETVFQVAMAWSTYRTLVTARGMDSERVQAWIGHLYERMLLP